MAVAPVTARDPWSTDPQPDRLDAACHRVGADGVEVTSFGGHLIEQFFDPAVNNGQDEYGGSLENRVRFGREVLAAVREATSEDFVIGFRVTADQRLPSGMSQADLRAVVRAVTADGHVDLTSVTSGTGYTDRTTSFSSPPRGRRRRGRGRCRSGPARRGAGAVA